MRLLFLLLLGHLAGCESCEWSFGPLEVSGHLTVKGTRPSDLEILACSGPRADDCGAYPVGNLEADRYTAEIPPEGVFTCGFPHRWLVARGTGCTTTAIEALSTDDLDTNFARAPITLDLVVRCSE